jgi:peptidoglycan hydrolase CwlO-like protein
MKDSDLQGAQDFLDKHQTEQISNIHTMIHCMQESINNLQHNSVIENKRITKLQEENDKLRAEIKSLGKLVGDIGIGAL